MKVPFRQLKAGGCSFYTLANLFNDKYFLQFVEEAGHSTWDMDQALSGFADLHMETIVQLSHALEQQNRFFDVSIFGFTPSEKEEENKSDRESLLPWFVSIGGPGRLAHIMLVLQDMFSNKLIVVDSLEENIIETTQEDFMLDYYVTGLMRLGKNGQKYLKGENVGAIIFKKDILQHLIPTYEAATA